MQDIQLSKNFYLSEFTKSQEAIRKSIDNIPSDIVVNNLRNLVLSVLQPLRDKLGRVVSISSGYRSKALNKAIGGSSTSDHCEGYAADIEVHGMSNKDLAEFIRKNFKFKQLILEFHNEDDPSSGWVHVSYKPDDLKCEYLVASKNSAGKTIYTKI